MRAESATCYREQVTTRGIVQVSTPEVAGATLHRHPLEREASRLMTLCRRVGQRLNRWFRDMPELQASQYWVRGAVGEPSTLVTRKDKDGIPIMEPVVPDRDMIEVFRWYQNAVLGLLKEQRMRASMKDGRPELSDAEMEAELHQLAADTLQTMPRADLERILAERDAIDVPADAPPTPANPREEAQLDERKAAPEDAPADLLSFEREPDE